MREGGLAVGIALVAIALLVGFAFTASLSASGWLLPASVLAARRFSSDPLFPPPKR